MRDIMKAQTKTTATAGRKEIVKYDDLQELRKGTVIYSDCEELEFVEKGISLYHFVDRDTNELCKLTEQEVMRYRIMNYYEIECIRNDYKSNYDRYVEDAYTFIKGKLNEGLERFFADIKLEEYLTEKHSNWAKYQVKEVTEEALERVDEEC